MKTQESLVDLVKQHPLTAEEVERMLKIPLPPRIFRTALRLAKQLTNSRRVTVIDEYDEVLYQNRKAFLEHPDLTQEQRAYIGELIIERYRR